MGAARKLISTDKLHDLKVNERALLFTLQQAGSTAVSVSEAAVLMRWTPCNAGHVLRSLAAKGFLHSRKYGTFKMYALNI